MTAKKAMGVWHKPRRRAHLTHERGAVIQRTHYGVDIEYSDGRVSSLWEFALTEPVLDAAMRRARRDGAEFILVEPG
jgi:hypothetical protein